jgi:hypothetical protein
MRADVALKVLLGAVSTIIILAAWPLGRLAAWPLGRLAAWPLGRAPLPETMHQVRLVMLLLAIGGAGHDHRAVH